MYHLIASIYIGKNVHELIAVMSLTSFKPQEGDDGNMVYVNEKGKVDISREGKFMSVMPPGKSLQPLSTISIPLKFT